MTFFNRYGKKINQDEANSSIFKVSDNIFVDQYGADVQTLYAIEDQLSIKIEKVVAYTNHGAGKSPTLSLRSGKGIMNHARRLTKEINL